MRTTRSWIQKHKIVLLGLGIAMCATMLTPELTDAGWRRRARRCWHQAGYYTQPHAYSNHGYSNYGNFHSQATVGQNGYEFQSGTMTDTGEYQAKSNARPTVDADVNSQQNYTARRPILNGQANDVAPPAPLRDNANQNSLDTNSRQNTTANAEVTPQQARQMRQQIQSLQQEVSRLEQQLKDARQNQDRTESDAQIRQNTEAEAGVDLRTPAGAELNSNGDADSQLRQQSEIDTKVKSNK